MAFSSSPVSVLSNDMSKVKTKLTNQNEKGRLESLLPAKVNWRSIVDALHASELESDASCSHQKCHDQEMVCMRTMLKILSLEESCTRLSSEMDHCALASLDQHGFKTDLDVITGVACNDNQVSPMTLDENDVAANPTENRPGFVSPASQISLNAIRHTWNWVEKLNKCVGIHLHNSLTFHQFFMEFSENEKWMQKDLDRILKAYRTQETKRDVADVQRQFIELQEIGRILKHWHAKVDRMWIASRNVVPVELRTTTITEATPARSLCHFATKEIEFDEDEDLLLLESHKGNTRWRVSNGRGQTGEVPSVIILLPGTEPQAVKNAVQLRLALMEDWTDILKTLGQHVMSSMLHVFRPDFTLHEAETLRMMLDSDKRELLRLLISIEQFLNRVWPEHPDFISVRDRLQMLRRLLQQAPLQQNEYSRTPTDLSLNQALVVQIGSLQQLLEAYQQNIVLPLKELWTQWNIIRISPEINGQPQIRELMEKWEKEQVRNKVYFASFWQSDTPLYEMTRTLSELYKFQVAGIVLQEPEARALQASHAPTWSVRSSESSENEMPTSLNSTLMSLDSTLQESDLEEDSSDFGIGSETKIAKTEQYLATESEENKKFVIRSVVDPTNNEEISLKEAINRGVIRPSEGTYVNLATSELKPIPVAMKEGLIKVMFTTTKRTKEKKSSIGVITVKTIREKTRPYRVNSVVDTRTGKELTREEAVEQNVIDEGKGSYIDRRTGLKMLIAEAVEIGLVNIEYSGETPSPEVVSDTYAVHAVLDRSQQKFVTFLDAARRGIVDKESGIYRDTVTGQKMYVGDAILQGFMKARLVEDVTKLSVDAATEQ